jgi:hypothetical protein
MLRIHNPRAGNPSISLLPPITVFSSQQTVYTIIQYSSWVDPLAVPGKIINVKLKIEMKQN